MTHFYRKKPITIEAAKFKGTDESAAKISAWIESEGGVCQTVPVNESSPILLIDTEEGTMRATKGDYIIKEPHPTHSRKFYPCKPDIFQASYERVDAPS